MELPTNLQLKHAFQWLPAWYISKISIFFKGT